MYSFRSVTHTSFTYKEDEEKITISRKKLELGDRIHFAGHIISDGGIRPYDDKFAALRNFQQPNNVKELRSFPSLVAQFGTFAPDTACLTSHPRQLLQKETPWFWLPEHNLDFENTKKALTCPTMLQPFDHNVKTGVQRTPLFCPATSQSTQLRRNQMSMSTFGFIAHVLRPSTPTTDSPNTPRKSPQTVTGNRYSIFTSKNYGDNEMHWFWMVLIWALLLFAWWKLRRYCRGAFFKHPGHELGTS